MCLHLGSFVVLGKSGPRVFKDVAGDLLCKQDLYTGTHLQALRCRCLPGNWVWGGGQVYIWGHRIVIMQKCKSASPHPLTFKDLKPIFLIFIC